MHLSVLIAIVLLLAIFCGIFTYRPHTTYQAGDMWYVIIVIIAVIAALLLFLMSINVIHI